MQAELKNDFDLQKGETLKHCGSYIKVNGTRNVRYYTLKGKLLLKEESPSESFYPLDGSCFILRDGRNVKFLTKNGEEIITDRKLVKFDYLRNPCRINLVKLYDESGKMAIFDCEGECLLDFDNYKITDFLKNIIIYSKNGKDFKVYNLYHKKLIEGTYEKVSAFGNGVYLKTPNGFKFYNIETEKIQYSVDAFFGFDYIIKRKDGNRINVFFDIVYKNNKCGLIASTWCNDDFTQKLVVPIECSKIEKNPENKDEIRVWTKEGIKTLSQNALYAEYFENMELSKEEVEEREKTTTIKLFDKFEVEEDDKVFFYGNYVVIYNYHEDIRHKQICYKTDGTLIGNVGIVSDDDGYEDPNIVVTDNWIAIGNDCWSNMPSLVNRFQVCKIIGVKELEGKIFKSLVFKNGFYILSDKPGFENENLQNHFFAIFDKSGKLILILNKVNKIIDINENYIEALDTKKNLWFYDFKGNKIFSQWLDLDNAHHIKDTVWVKIPDGYIVYDCLTGKSQVVSIEEYESFIYDNLYLFSKNGLYGLYQYTIDRKTKTSISGFKEIIPIECEKIIDIFSSKNLTLIRAVKKDTEEIYESNGKLIAKTVI